MRKFCGERSVVYIIIVLPVLIYLPSTVKHASMTQCLMIDRGYLHGGRGPPRNRVSTDLERDMLSGVIPYKDMPCFVSKFILHSLTLAGEEELTNKKITSLQDLLFVWSVVLLYHQYIFLGLRLDLYTECEQCSLC